MMTDDNEKEFATGDYLQTGCSTGRAMEAGPELGRCAQILMVMFLQVSEYD